MNGRAAPAAFEAGRGIPRKKFFCHTPAQPLVCEGAYAQKALETSYRKCLQMGGFYFISVPCSDGADSRLNAG